jgi:hypothetical protein
VHTSFSVPGSPPQSSSQRATNTPPFYTVRFKRASPSCPKLLALRAPRQSAQPSQLLCNGRTQDPVRYESALEPQQTKLPSGQQSCPSCISQTSTQYLTTPHHLNHPTNSPVVINTQKSLTQPNSQTGLGLHPSNPPSGVSNSHRPARTHTHATDGTNGSRPRGGGGLDTMRSDPAEQARAADHFLARSPTATVCLSVPGLSVITVAASLAYTAAVWHCIAWHAMSNHDPWSHSCLALR